MDTVSVDWRRYWLSPPPGSVYHGIMLLALYLGLGVPFYFSPGNASIRVD
jgi:hypothetical protein